ncbi:XANTHINE/URACIL PERMEASE C887.17-RELATED [Salix koriyanagi]|uniref:XANTHINE/URACIL PERMEASE C887.17-RELATED n=2 Tax=Salix TaxID=40685 RepID=A0A9Q0W255_9ROSI|nr:XANTHINE/URACIL PERMEASE C887.17-RELATED [Salix koriyanagi]
MPLTYSIAYGLIGGIGTYIVLHVWDWGEECLVRFGVVNKRDGGGVNGVHDDHQAPQNGSVKSPEIPV